MFVWQTFTIFAVPRCSLMAMRRIPKLAAVCAFTLAGVMQISAQETLRVRGTIERVEGGTYIVISRAGDSLRLRLASHATVAASVRVDVADIKPGAYIGTAAVPQPDGNLRALEVHIFHESMRCSGEGHRAWDLLPQSTMTNATVDDVVTSRNGRSVTLKYNAGEQRIQIEPGTTVISYLPGHMAELAPGATTFVPAAARQPDGSLVAERIMVGRDVAPPQ